MPASNDIQGRADEVRALVEDDRIEDAVRRLMDFVADFSDSESKRRESKREVTVLSADVKRLEKAARQGMITFEDAGRQRRHLLFQMLTMLDDIEVEPSPPPPRRAEATV
jgi:hemerythrin-like domain-containing protein